MRFRGDIDRKSFKVGGEKGSLEEKDRRNIDEFRRFMRMILRI